MRVVQDVAGICPCLIISFLSALSTKRRWRSKTELLLFVSLCEDAWQTAFRQSFFGREDRLAFLMSILMALAHFVWSTVNWPVMPCLTRIKAFSFTLWSHSLFPLQYCLDILWVLFVHLLLSRFYEHEHRSNILCPTTNYTAFKSEKLTTIR